MPKFPETHPDVSRCRPALERGQAKVKNDAICLAQGVDRKALKQVVCVWVLAEHFTPECILHPDILDKPPPKLSFSISHF